MNAGTGSGQDGFGIRTIAGIAHLALTSSRPGHTRVSSQSPVRKRLKSPAKPPNTPLSSELQHCTPYPNFVRKPLGLNPWVREELS